MIYSVNELRKDTVALIKQIDEQIAAIELIAKDLGVPAVEYRTPDGNWALPPLLLSKATAYNTLVMLQTPAASPPPRGTARR